MPGLKYFVALFLVGNAHAAPGTLGSLTAAGGLYSNKILNLTPAVGYTEICWVGGVRLSDYHPVSGPTTGGNCAPGDLGFLIENAERPAAQWNEAMEECLMVGMRLPEAFEYITACDEATLGGLPGFTDDNEWASNTGSHSNILILGNGGCTSGGASGFGSAGAGIPFRCAL
jgi:hypothetical protein